MIKEKVILWKLKVDFTLTIMRITEQIGLKGIFKGHLVQPLCNEQGHVQLDQDALGPVQADCECFWG